jgi:hypothetical protein
LVPSYGENARRFVRIFHRYAPKDTRGSGRRVKDGNINSEHKQSIKLAYEDRDENIYDYHNVFQTTFTRLAPLNKKPVKRSGGSILNGEDAVLVYFTPFQNSSKEDQNSRFVNFVLETCE